MSSTDLTAGRAAFSQDILKIEISGPDVSCSLIPSMFVGHSAELTVCNSKAISLSLMSPESSGWRLLVSK